MSQTVVSLAFLGFYVWGLRMGLPVAMVPWQARTWAFLMAQLAGCVRSSGNPEWVSLALDCMAMFIMVQADDRVTLAVFSLTMLIAYGGEPGGRPHA
ncbi:MAG: hypothetical protein AB7D57_07035 [Desulfovibrionaceae bacterium]